MSTPHQTTLTFLGTSTATPDLGSDTASFLINNKYLVDTGWCSVTNLRNLGINPSDLEYVFFTHFHHDHYLSLPSLLFYLISKKSLSNVTFIGPVDDLEPVIQRALDFLQAKRFWKDLQFPKLVPLTPGESYETDQFKITTCPTLHPVQGLCYRFYDHLSGKEFSFTGDTAYFPPIIEHVKGTPLLIHEASVGAAAANPENNSYLHSGAVDAAKIAKLAEVGQLMLIHGPLGKASECVKAASDIFPNPVIWPEERKPYIL
ncbi:MBL fold metallo-hydrolase [Paenibacillus cremeus]|uniref:MBL fold metallo-hydrolase n=1 Tax=Paenibacillus cremeus TaxID=2163881 RepID=A0A559K5C6_9BACL|nr:MBL fold metallo-hydrolase [Paenibacillus cremeus]TVY07332.1 MBL fold metallo-hydrolase [Paenibacillus cremeus]